VQYKEVKEQLLSLAIPLDAAVNAAEVQSYEEREAKRQKSDGSEEKETPIKPQIPLEAVMENYARESSIAGYMSPVTNSMGVALVRSRFKTFPKYLFVHLRKYIVGDNWLPKKLDVLIKAPEMLDLEFLRSQGVQPGEELMPEAAAAAASEPAPRPVPDQNILDQLMSMGFNENGSKRACLATNNASAEAAMEWVLQHMEDADFNDPIDQPGPTASGGAAVSAESVAMLEGMGFAKKHAEKALKECSGSLERAADWLFSRIDSLDSMDLDDAPADAGADVAAPLYKPQYRLKAFISHVGSSTNCGHYVCHIKKDGKKGGSQDVAASCFPLCVCVSRSLFFESFLLLPAPYPVFHLVCACMSSGTCCLLVVCGRICVGAPFCLFFHLCICFSCVVRAV
jgi:ubiquitin carboxyl-terminal hydrolase 5/13